MLAKFFYARPIGSGARSLAKIFLASSKNFPRPPRFFFFYFSFFFFGGRACSAPPFFSDLRKFFQKIFAPGEILARASPKFPPGLKFFEIIFSKSNFAPAVPPTFEKFSKNILKILKIKINFGASAEIYFYF
jgi:hypothetical protein